MFPTTVRVNVLKKHIEMGERGNCYQCPISLAIHEAFQKLGTPPQPYLGVKTEFTGFIVSSPDDARHYCRYEPKQDTDNNRVYLFISGFDNGEKVETVRFTIKKVEEVEPCND